MIFPGAVLFCFFFWVAYIIDKTNDNTRIHDGHSTSFQTVEMEFQCVIALVYFRADGASGYQVVSNEISQLYPEDILNGT